MTAVSSAEVTDGDRAEELAEWMANHFDAAVNEDGTLVLDMHGRPIREGSTCMKCLRYAMAFILSIRAEERARVLTMVEELDPHGPVIAAAIRSLA